MDDKQKIEHHEAIKHIRARMGGCFGTADNIFCTHPNDEERAKELRTLALNTNVTKMEMMEIVVGYLVLRRQISSIEHIRKQMARAEKFFLKLPD